MDNFSFEALKNNLRLFYDQLSRTSKLCLSLLNMVLLSIYINIMQKTIKYVSDYLHVNIKIQSHWKYSVQQKSYDVGFLQWFQTELWRVTTPIPRTFLLGGSPLHLSLTLGQVQLLIQVFYIIQMGLNKSLFEVKHWEVSDSVIPGDDNLIVFRTCHACSFLLTAGHTKT